MYLHIEYKNGNKGTLDLTRDPGWRRTKILKEYRSQKEVKDAYLSMSSTPNPSSWKHIIICENMINIQDKTFNISANLCNIKWNRQPSTLPSTCRIKITITMPAQQDTVPELTLRKEIAADVQRRYHVWPHDFNITDLMIYLV